MRRTINIAAIAIIVLTSAAVSASGQVSQHYKASIPFDFSVGKTDMQSGNYAIAILNSSSTISVLGLVNRDTGEIRLISPVIKGDFGENSGDRLRFARAGSRYELIAVQTPDFETTLRHTRVDVRQDAKARIPKEETVSLRLR